MRMKMKIRPVLGLMVVVAISSFGEAKPLEWFPVPRDPAKDYHQSGRVSAGFFHWFESDRSPGIVEKLNAAAREKCYLSDIFKRETRTTLDDIWAEYRTFRRNPATSGEEK